MKEISNTHLKKHNLTKSKYVEIDEDFKKYQSKKMSNMAKQRKQVWNKNKTYEELLGKEEAEKRNKQRSINTKKSLSKIDMTKTSKQKRDASKRVTQLYKEYPEIKEKIRKIVKEGYKKYPERRINMSKIKKEWAKNNKEHYIKMVLNSRKSQAQQTIKGTKGFISKPQLELYNLIKQKYPEAELEYPIRTKHSVRFADIGIPSLKLDIEYDGIFWHTNKQLDDLRDKHLAEVSWKTIRFNKNNIQVQLNEVLSL